MRSSAVRTFQPNLIMYGCSNMNDLIEFIEDLETIQTLTNHPALEETIERILTKHEERLADYEADMARQHEFNLV